MVSTTSCLSIEEMEARLHEIPRSESYLYEKELHKKIKNKLLGEKKVTAIRIVILLESAIYDMSVNQIAVFTLMQVRKVQLIIALAPDDTIAKDAIDIWNRMNNNSNVNAY